MTDQIKFLLGEEELPRSWYNIIADLPEPPAPVIHPGTGQPVGPDDLAPLFPMASIMQEVSHKNILCRILIRHDMRILKIEAARNRSQQK